MTDTAIVKNTECWYINEINNTFCKLFAYDTIS